MIELPFTRAAAMAIGSAWYFTGTTCARDHVVKRYTKNGHCVECQRARNEAELPQWREQNRDRHLAAMRDYNRAHSVELYAKKKARRDADREAFRAERRDYYARNRERLSSYFRVNKAQRRGSDGKFTPADLLDIRRGQRNRCAYCRRHLDRVKVHIDHIWPVSRNGTSHRRNIQLLCASCNGSKNAQDPIIFARKLGRLL